MDSTANRRIRVLTCDDSAFVRVALKQILEAGGMEVCGVARNGREAVEKAHTLKPDLITMDVEMPEMDGVEALRAIVAAGIAPVIMLSSLTQKGAEKTLEALEIGAFDCVGKPGGSRSLEQDGRELVALIRKAVQYRRAPQRDREPVPARSETPKPGMSSPAGSLEPRVRTRPTPVVTAKEAVVVPRPAPSGLGYLGVGVGISTGGPKSIFEVLPGLPRDLNAAVFLVQHMPPPFIPAYAQRIASRCQMECRVSEPGLEVHPGVIYVAAGGTHLKFHVRGSRVMLRHSQEPEHLFMPSVDVMLHSLRDTFGQQGIGVLMTGMGWDGAEGMVAIHQAGGRTIAESKETAIVFGMPHEAIKRGGAQKILPHRDIAREIIRMVKESKD